jgi:stearoyl-CoA desaturase (delta-9 desaturase)
MFIVFPLMHIVVLYGIFTSEYWYLLLISGLLMYYPIMNLGQSIGYHKCFAHKSFKPKKWFTYVSAFVGSISFFGDPLRSALVHRVHHKHTDSDLDPHSPSKGRFHAYLGWTYSYSFSNKDKYLVMDLVRTYPWMLSFSKWEWVVLPIFHSIIYLLSPELFLVIMMGCLLAMNTALIVNAYSHKLTDDGWVAVDYFWLGKYVNPIFIHKQHHAESGKWNYGYGKVNDFTAWFIKTYLTDDKQGTV